MRQAFAGLTQEGASAAGQPNWPDDAAAVDSGGTGDTDGCVTREIPAAASDGRTGPPTASYGLITFAAALSRAATAARILAKPRESAAIARC